jgi:predicted NUDIX family NTP pyrophosphohydrolase
MPPMAKKRRSPDQPAGSKNVSAGLLMFRDGETGIELFLAHPGGPFWKHKDLGAWTIPKGLVNEGETPLTAAFREFAEETGLESRAPYIELGTVRQKAGKLIHAWAFRGTADAQSIKSNFVRLRTAAGWRQFPEIDRCGWFEPDEARQKLNPAQAALVDRLLANLDEDYEQSGGH